MEPQTTRSVFPFPDQKAPCARGRVGKTAAADTSLGQCTCIILTEYWRNGLISLVTSLTIGDDGKELDAEINKVRAAVSKESTVPVLLERNQETLPSGTAQTGNSHGFVNKCLRSPCSSLDKGISWPQTCCQDAELHLQIIS
jgi:hypothetical protein